MRYELTDPEWAVSPRQKVVSMTRVSMYPWNNGNHADFLSERFNVDMILAICALRSCADLPNAASSRSLNSMSFSDIPADLSETAKLKKRALPRQDTCEILATAPGKRKRTESAN
jgi:hypothetical protein